MGKTSSGLQKEEIVQIGEGNHVALGAGAGFNVRRRHPETSSPSTATRILARCPFRCVAQKGAGRYSGSDHTVNGSREPGSVYSGIRRGGSPVRIWYRVMTLLVGFTVLGLAQPPSFSASSVLNGASLTAGAIAPGEQVIISGSNLGDVAATTCIVNSVAPTSCGNVSVLVNGKAAPLFSISAGQISFQVPFGITGASATLQISRQTSGQTLQSAVVTVPLAPTSPGLYPSKNYCGTLGDFIGQSGLPITPLNPAQLGETVRLYGTGFGATNPAMASGSPAPTG